MYITEKKNLILCDDHQYIKTALNDIGIINIYNGVLTIDSDGMYFVCIELIHA